MKRFFALVVVLCLMLPGLPGVAEEKKLHLLWDIPFDTPIQEVADLLYEKVGIVYEVASEEGDAIKLRSMEDQEISFFGYAVEESFVRTEEKHAGINSISFFMKPYEATDVSYSNLLDQADDILTQLTQAYGSLDQHSVELFFDHDEAENYVEYRYPFTADGKVDRERLASALSMVDDGSVLFLQALWLWNNVVVLFVYSNYGYPEPAAEVTMIWYSTSALYDEMSINSMP